jgi:hypothetical protein
MSLNASPDTDDRLVKRPRIVGTQSKYGCFTCKYGHEPREATLVACDLFVIARSRRIKCDESKPHCCRCQRSNIECEGYPLRAYSDTKKHPSPHQSGFDSPESHLDAFSAKETQPTYALLDGFRRSPVQDRLARLGCSVLRDGLHDQFQVSRAVFECLLPQLSYALPSVNAAAAALGAVYEMQTAPLSAVDGKTLLVASQYGAAVREVQHELSNRPYGAVPILVACVLLASADVLLCRRRLALMHLRGAIKLLEERNAISSNSRAMDSLVGINDHSTSSMDSLPLEESDDDITVLFRLLDVQTISYADGFPPEMHTALVRTPQDTASSSPCIHRIGRELIALIQTCYCFTSHALQYTYRPQILVPTDLLIEQGRHIATLKLWLRRLTYDLLPCMEASIDSKSAASSNYMHCLMLRNLCLAAIIYVSSILDAYETGWDIHARYFQEIITGAELILENRRRRRCGELSSAAFTFTPSPGIIQPLYLTALKYRHPRWRRRALELLRQSGKEGPWDGKLMAAAAQRAIDIEESELVRDRDCSVGVDQADAGYDGKVHLEDIVPERVRISGCGPETGDYVEEEILKWEWIKDSEYMSHIGSTGRRNVSPVRFSRCRDVHKMLAAGLDGQVPGEEAAWKDKRHWEMWSEIVEF